MTTKRRDIREKIGTITKSGVDTNGFWFEFKLDDGCELPLSSWPECPICLKLLPTLYHINGRRRIYCSQRCFRIGYINYQASVDPIVVYRLVHGDPPEKVTRAERMEATAWLTKRGLSLREIAELLHTTERTVSRHRKQLKEGIT